MEELISVRRERGSAVFRVHAFNYAEPTSQRPVGLSEESGMIKPGQPRGMNLTMFYSLPKSTTKVKSIEEKKGSEPVCQNGTANFSPIDQSGPPPEVFPNIPVGLNQKGPFHMTSVRNFWNFWHGREHPRSLLSTHFKFVRALCLPRF